MPESPLKTNVAPNPNTDSGRDKMNRASQDSADALQQAQTQLNSIRQARDAAQANVRELTDKLARSSDQISELEYDLEQEKSAREKAAKQVAELQERLGKPATEGAGDVGADPAVHLELSALKENFAKAEREREELRLKLEQAEAASVEKVGELAALQQKLLESQSGGPSDQSAELTNLQQELQKARSEQEQLVQKLAQTEAANADEIQQFEVELAALQLKLLESESVSSVPDQSAELTNLQQDLLKALSEQEQLVKRLEQAEAASAEKSAQLEKQRTELHQKLNESQSALVAAEAAESAELAILQEKLLQRTTENERLSKTFEEAVAAQNEKARLLESQLGELQERLKQSQTDSEKLADLQDELDETIAGYELLSNKFDQAAASNAEKTGRFESQLAELEEHLNQSQTALAAAQADQTTALELAAVREELLQTTTDYEELTKMFEEAEVANAQKAALLEVHLKELQDQLTESRASLAAAQAKASELTTLQAEFLKVTAKLEQLDHTFTASEAAHAERIDQFEAQVIDLQTQLAQSQAALSSAEADQSSASDLAALEQELVKSTAEHQLLLKNLEEAEAAHAQKSGQLENQLAELQQQLEQSQGALSAAQGDANAASEVVALKEELLKTKAEHEELTKQVAELTALNEAANEVKTQKLEQELAAVHQHESQLQHEVAEESAKLKGASKRGEEHRKLAIDLAAQLEAARREIIELTASLAEARLEAKFAKSSATRAAAAAADPSAPAPVPVRPKPLHEEEASGLLQQMRGCLERFACNPTVMDPLHELYTQGVLFAQRTEISGMVALHRLGFAFASLTNHLIEFPDSLTQSNFNTMHQTVEFLLALVREGNLTALKDPSSAHVYAVDDEPENCELMAMGLEMVLLTTVYSPEPKVALSDLASGNFDLIFLDINLPEMDGFELCQQIRLLPGYAATPIVFVTGSDTAQNRQLSNHSGASDFITKPFNIYEVNVKALTLLLQKQISKPA